jgi:hypothetical protein
MADAPVSIHVADGCLRIDAPTGFDRASLLGALDIPLEHVVSVEEVDKPGESITGWREGIGLPHLRMGTWRHDGVKDYIAVRTDTPGLVITLRHEEFARLIVSVDDPAGVAATLAQRD